jgi:hypothetical protein
MTGAVAELSAVISGGVGGLPSEISLSLPCCERVFIDMKSMAKAVAAGL